MHREISLSHRNFLTLHDDQGHTFLGADQEWFPLLWQRKAGCGPTVASTLVLYLSHQNPSLGLRRIEDKQGMTALMEEVWTHVTPGIMGLHLVSQFTKGLSSFFAAHQLAIPMSSLALPKDRTKRPSLKQVVSYITTALEADQPVAFLNLSAGSLENLDSWHWVTVVSLIQETEGSPVMIEVFDGGRSWNLNLSAWYESTTRSAGFACIQ
jgi:hypothetical protein